MKKTKAQSNSEGIPDAYDIKTARQECKAADLQSRLVIAWMEDGTLKLSQNVNAFKASAADDSTESDRTAPPRHVRCLAVSRGDHFSAWKEGVVRKMLLNPPCSDNGKQWDYTPIKDTIFDHDLKDSAWYPSTKETLEQRCRAFALGVLMERDNLDRLAREAVASYGEPSANKSHSAREIEWRMENIGQAIQRLQRHIGFMSIGDSPDAGVALRQGLRIGMWLAEVGAIIANERNAKLNSQIGVSGRKLGVFWSWVMTKQEWFNKPDKEVFGLLNNEADPEFPEKKRMSVRGSVLHRGNGTTLKESSFYSKYRALRAAQTLPQIASD